MPGSVGISALYDGYKDSAVNGEIMINPYSGMISFKNTIGDVVSFDKATRTKHVLEFLELMYKHQLVSDFYIYNCGYAPCVIDSNTLEAIDLNGVMGVSGTTNISLYFDIMSQDSNGNYVVPTNIGQTATVHFTINGVDESVTINVNDFSSITDMDTLFSGVSASECKITSIQLWDTDSPFDILLDVYIVALPQACNGLHTNVVAPYPR